jgi:hypothetical protein
MLTLLHRLMMGEHYSPLTKEINSEIFSNPYKQDVKFSSTSDIVSSVYRTTTRLSLH